MTTFWLVYFMVGALCTSMICMMGTDQRGTPAAYTRWDVLKLSILGWVPVIQWFYSAFVLWAVVSESDRFEAFRNWFKEDF